MTAANGFSVSCQSAGDRVSVEVSGELDLLTEPTLIEAVRNALTGEAPSRAVIDLTRIEFIDSSGLRALLVCRGTAEERGVALSLVVGDGPVGRLLDLAGVTDWFSVE